MMVSLHKRILRLLPAFFVLAFVAWGLAYLFRVPGNRLATVAMIPMVIFFLLTRIAILCVPRTELTEEERAIAEKIPLVAKIAIPIFILVLVAGLIALASSAAYRSVGLAVSSQHALSISAIAFSTALAVFVLLLLTSLGSTEKPLPVKEVANVEASFFWIALRSPGVLAVFVFGHFGGFQSRY